MIYYKLLILLSVLASFSCGRDYVKWYDLDMGFIVEGSPDIEKYNKYELETALDIAGFFFHQQDPDRFAWGRLRRAWYKSDRWRIRWVDHKIYPDSKKCCECGCSGITSYYLNLIMVKHNNTCLAKTAFVHEAAHYMMWFITGLDKRHDHHKDPAFYPVIKKTNEILNGDYCE